MKHYIFLALLLLSSFGAAAQTHFNAKGLADTFLDEDGEEVTFSTILEENKGQSVLIDIWASWCKDCIVGLPKLNELLESYPDVSLVCISLDKTEEKWHAGIEKYYENQGQHFFAPKGWKSDLFTTIDLDWIPRYLLLDKTGKITVFKAIKADDKNLINQLRKQENEK